MSYRRAMADSLWKQAMEEKINSLLRNGTWQLVPSTLTQKLVDCRWIFRIKVHPDGTLDHCKARLVAQGFTQRPGIHFRETYSHVIKPATIRLVLTIAITCRWSMRQLNVSNHQNSKIPDIHTMYVYCKSLSTVFVKPPGPGSFDLLPHYISWVLPNASQTHLYLYGTEDIAYSVSMLSQFLRSPTVAHVQAAKRILRYLKVTASFGIPIRPTNLSRLVAYPNADWAGCPATPRSTTSYAVYISDNLPSWRSKQQPTVARSSTEVEYRALAYAAAELMWLSSLSSYLHLPLRLPLVICCDNIGATYLAANPI
ncbi:hypothetical protein MLD38_023440 [Melastoma candidum]|uniref:Uncharacterized protein n=1 Tax=Melastoma candidum TaxID=119954 RepID=A0ACB9NS38_9MYRT|nr:hypothetical protein MLD38_023440 [Melastoma candidum]